MTRRCDFDGELSLRSRPWNDFAFAFILQTDIGYVSHLTGRHLATFVRLRDVDSLQWYSHGIFDAASQIPTLRGLLSSSALSDAQALRLRQIGRHPIEDVGIHGCPILKLSELEKTLVDPAGPATIRRGRRSSCAVEAGEVFFTLVGPSGLRQGTTTLRMIVRPRSPHIGIWILFRRQRRHAASTQKRDIRHGVFRTSPCSVR